jgi:hypothetical protein
LNQYVPSHDPTGSSEAYADNDQEQFLSPVPAAMASASGRPMPVVADSRPRPLPPMAQQAPLPQTYYQQPAAAQRTGVAEIPPRDAMVLPMQVVQYLKQRIERTCGGQARAVEIVPLSMRGILVHIQAGPRVNKEKLGSQVLQMPELKPYAVKLQIDD